MLPFFFLKLFPKLKKQLKTANIKEEPRAFIRKMLFSAIFLSLVLFVMLFFVFGKSKTNSLLLVLMLPVIYMVSFYFMMQYPFVLIRKRMKEIDQEVLFAGRYLLVKIESGTPLFNALTDAAKSYGVMSKYFREIVENILSGVTIEDALEDAREHSASKKFKKILAELITSLKTGVEVGPTLHAILKNISNEQMLEIKEYSKKLNAYVTIYMIVAVVLPSLGMTMLVIVGAFLSLELSMTFILIAVGVLVFLQLMFITLFRSIRPVVNL